MNDLRVLFTAAAGHGYLARLTDTDDTELGVEIPFTPFLDDGDYKDLRWYLEDYMDRSTGDERKPLAYCTQERASMRVRPSMRAISPSGSIRPSLSGTWRYSTPKSVSCIQG